MAVLKTTSPTTTPAAPQAWPRNKLPSSNASNAGVKLYGSLSQAPTFRIPDGLSRLQKGEVDAPPRPRLVRGPSLADLTSQLTYFFCRWRGAGFSIARLQGILGIMDAQSDHRQTRRDYGDLELRRAALAQDPLRQFAAWLDEAVSSGAQDATAMALATADAEGAPSVRTVLLKHFDAQGFCWYTDYRSRKGEELRVNPLASALFLWRGNSRQVRISGPVERLTAAESDAYFQSRPEDSRYAAAASVQSAPVADRRTLERAAAALRRRHPHGDVPRPSAWGGYRLRPVEYEFWQGRDGRLHDRFVFRRGRTAGWVLTRLQP